MSCSHRSRRRGRVRYSAARRRREQVGARVRARRGTERASAEGLVDPKFLPGADGTLCADLGSSPASLYKRYNFWLHYCQTWQFLLAIVAIPPGRTGLSRSRDNKNLTLAISSAFAARRSLKHSRIWLNKPKGPARPKSKFGNSRLGSARHDVCRSKGVIPCVQIGRPSFF